MAEYIEREAALDAISGWLMKALHTENMSSYNEGERAAYRTALSKIANLHAADVRPVVRGRWEYNPGDNIPYCSECMMPQDSECNFCPSCGADMRPTSMSGANGEER